MRKIFLFIALAGLLTACNRPLKVRSTEGEMITIDASLDAIADSDYVRSLVPIKEAIKAEMGIVIGKCEVPMEVFPPECPMLNWASDALLEEARKYYPGKVDGAIVNRGGMRCNWHKGPLTVGNVFELMPFDNELVVLTLKGEDILELCQIFASQDGEGVANIRMRAEDKQLIDATIGGKPIEPERLYHIATSDYLSGGNDKMTPLTRATECWTEHLLIRDLYIDYIKRHKNISAQIDGRMMLYEENLDSAAR